MCHNLIKMIADRARNVKSHGFEKLINQVLSLQE